MIGFVVHLRQPYDARLALPPTSILSRSHPGCPSIEAALIEVKARAGGFFTGCECAFPDPTLAQPVAGMDMPWASPHPGRAERSSEVDEHALRFVTLECSFPWRYAWVHTRCPGDALWHW